MVARRKAFEPIQTAFVKVGHRIFMHRHRAGFVGVQSRVTIQIGIDRHAAKPRLTRVVVAVGIKIIPLEAVRLPCLVLIARVTPSHRIAQQIRCQHSPCLERLEGEQLLPSVFALAARRSCG